MSSKPTLRLFCPCSVEAFLILASKAQCRYGTTRVYTSRADVGSNWFSNPIVSILITTTSNTQTPVEIHRVDQLHEIYGPEERPSSLVNIYDGWFDTDVEIGPIQEMFNRANVTIPKYDFTTLMSYVHG